MNNVDQVKQIVETIKTLNINFNDATTQKIAEAIMPIVKWYFIKDMISIFLQYFVVGGISIFTIILIYKLINKQLDIENK